MRAATCLTFTVGWQEEQFGACRAYRVTHCFVLMTAQVVHHHHVTWMQVRYQELNDPGQKTLGIDRSVEHAWRDDAITTQTCDEGQRLAMAVRHLRDQALIFGATTVQPRHVGLRPGFVDED